MDDIRADPTQEPGGLLDGHGGRRLPAGGARPPRDQRALERAAVDAHGQPGAEAGGRERAVGAQRADPELGVSAAGRGGAERALGVLERQPPARGDERRAVPQLPAPALAERGCAAAGAGRRRTEGRRETPDPFKLARPAPMVGGWTIDPAPSSCPRLAVLLAVVAVFVLRARARRRRARARRRARGRQDQRRRARGDVHVRPVDRAGRPRSDPARRRATPTRRPRR